MQVWGEDEEGMGMQLWEQGGSEMNNYTYIFTKGTRMTLDEIYFIQALGQDWWEHIPTKGLDGKETIGEQIIITRDVEISIKVTYPHRIVSKEEVR